MPGKRPELTHKVIVYDAPDTPYYRELFRQGLRALSDLIDENEMLHRKTEGNREEEGRHPSK